jgi:hypothetical protein
MIRQELLIAVERHDLRAEAILYYLVWRLPLISFVYRFVDLVCLDVILLFQDISGWILRKSVRGLDQF